VAQNNPYRAIWMSDLHLGTRGCKAEALLDFLRGHSAERLYLVGDIVDGWNLGSAWFWSPAQNAVVRELRKWGRRGVEIWFLPGNHDAANVALVRRLLGPIASADQLIHRTAEGRRMLVAHGHQFDNSLNTAHWLPMMGSRAYTLALRINEWYLGEGPRTAPRFLKARVRRTVRNALRHLTDVNQPQFKRAVIHAVSVHRADGIICGHIHWPQHARLGQILYVNDGDWVHSCTAVVEDPGGALRLVNGRQENCERAQHMRPLAVAGA